jgi:hypothetical protein
LVAMVGIFLIINSNFSVFYRIDMLML